VISLLRQADREARCSVSFALRKLASAATLPLNGNDTKGKRVKIQKLRPQAKAKVDGAVAGRIPVAVRQTAADRGEAPAAAAKDPVRAI